MKRVYSDLKLKPGAITAGIISVQVAPREWLTANPVIDFNTGKVLSAVALVAGRSWITLEFAPNTYDYNEKPKSNKSGSYYEVSLTGSLNNYDEAVQQVIESLRYHELVAVIKDRKKRNKLVGNKDAGFVISPSHRLKNASGGQEDSTIEMMMESEDPAPFYL